KDGKQTLLPRALARDPEGAGAHGRGAGVRGGRHLPLDRARARPRAVAVRRGGGGAVVARTTSDGATSCRAGVARSPSIRSTRARTASRPISSRGWLIVVSEMWRSAA